MLVHGLVESDAHPVSRKLEAENLGRVYSFLRSATSAGLELGQPVLSVDLIKAIHAHALAGLHPSAGQFRTSAVEVGDDFTPPSHEQVPALMEMFTLQVARSWERWDPLSLAGFVLWRVANIHPFLQGNGRTARAASHLVLCWKVGGWLPGSPVVSEGLRAHGPDYIAALRAVDESAWLGALDLGPLTRLLSRLTDDQLAGAEAEQPSRRKLRRSRA